MYLSSPQNNPLVTPKVPPLTSPTCSGVVFEVQGLTWG